MSRKEFKARFSLRPGKSKSRRTNNLPQFKKNLPQYLIWTVLFLGVFLRSAEYFQNRPLWSDEAFTTHKIIHYPLSVMVAPAPGENILEWIHSCAVNYPLGFIVLEKIAVFSLGTSELALRFIPFICGLISVFIFYKIAAEIFSGLWITVAVGLFAVSPSLIYFSSEIKPYSSDVLIVLLLYKLLQRDLSHWRGAFDAGIKGGMAIWYSFPALFVLMSTGAFCFLRAIVYKHFKAAQCLALSLTLWVISYGVYYFLSLRHLVENKKFVSYFSQSLMPIENGLVACAVWLVHGIKDFLGNTLAWPWFLTVLFFGFGLWGFLKSKRESLWPLLMPMVLVALVIVLKLYPFAGRTLLFLVPAVILIAVEGIREITSRFLKNHVWLSAALILFFLWPSAVASAKQLMESGGPEDMRSIMRFLAANQKEGDKVFMNNAAHFAAGYYDKLYNIPSQSRIVAYLGDGLSFDEKGPVLRYFNFYENSIGEFRWHQEIFPDRITIRYYWPEPMEKSPRTWVIFSHMTQEGEEYSLRYFDLIGKRMTEYHSRDASIYLYDFTTPPVEIRKFK